jgi:hypothetical protein
MSSYKLTKKNNKIKEQDGGFLFFGGTKKRKRQEFKTSMRNFCKVTRDGNNIPKGQKVTRRLINEVCSNFYEIEDESGFFGGIFNFVLGIVKKPVELAKSGIQKVTSSTESLSGPKKQVQPLDN